MRTPRHTVFVDTGVGNDKHREGSALWHMRRGTYLDDLRAVGVIPEQVDVVVCTHLHVDHVGWNTRLVDGRWVLTFPNARYVVAGEEWGYWRHEKDPCIADSVVPVVEASRVELVERHADTGTLILPAHFPRPGYIVRENGGHRFAPAVPGSASR